jgi:hypothetical protein
MREKSKKIMCGILENKMPTRASILSFEMAYGILGIGSAPPTTLRISSEVFLNDIKHQGLYTFIEISCFGMQSYYM